MLSASLLPRAVALHHHDLRAESARQRLATRAIAGPRTRGGSVILVAARRSRPSTLTRPPWRLRRGPAPSPVWRLAQG